MKRLKASKEEAKKNIIALLDKISYEDSGLKKLGLYDYVQMRDSGLGKKTASSNTVLCLESFGFDMFDSMILAHIFEEIFQNKDLSQKIRKIREGEKS